MHLDAGNFPLHSAAALAAAFCSKKAGALPTADSSGDGGDSIDGGDSVDTVDSGGDGGDGVLAETRVLYVGCGCGVIGLQLLHLGE